MKIIIILIESVIFGLVTALVVTPIGGVIIGLLVLNKGLKTLDKQTSKKEEKEES